MPDDFRTKAQCAQVPFYKEKSQYILTPEVPVCLTLVCLRQSWELSTGLQRLRLTSKRPLLSLQESSSLPGWRTGWLDHAGNIFNRRGFRLSLKLLLETHLKLKWRQGFSRHKTVHTVCKSLARSPTGPHQQEDEQKTSSPTPRSHHCTLPSHAA